MRHPHRLAGISLALAATAFLAVHAQTPSAAPGTSLNFNRIATFEVARNVPADRKDRENAVAEIVAATEDGRLLAYTDAGQKGLGLIDIANPAQPQPAGFIALDGEPTSVVITRGKALVAVSTTEKFFQPAGHLAVVDLQSRQVIDRCELQGQPDSLALDAAARHLVVAIENERDEKLAKGELPQLPAGNVSIVPLRAGMPDCTRLHPVSVSGLATVAPTDPEPEFVSVNAKGIAVVTLQENNHIALIDVARRQVVGHFSAGEVTVQGVDARRDGLIQPVDTLTNVRREPDAAAWLDDTRFVTANEGDYKGGSRGFTIFNTKGQVEFDSGNLLDRQAIRLGHYPERRSGAKGAEPEGVTVATFGKERLIFIGAERASLVYVFQDMGPGKAPKYLQALPTGTGPEGMVAIPQRNLLVATAEVSEPAKATVMIYQREARPAAYPSIHSVDGPEGYPIPWGAISGTVADRTVPGRLWAVTDSAYATTRILQIDASQKPALIRGAITLTKDGKPMGYDAEGIAQRADGSFWIASEGNPAKKPAAIDDILLRVSATGEVQQEIRLPDALRRHAMRFGFEGVTVTGQGADETVWLAVQREWKDDPKGFVKILSYRPASQQWGVYHYPLDKAEGAPKGTWVGLSEITAVGNDRFIVVERDNRFGDQAIKTLKSFSVAGLTPAAPGDAKVPVLAKRLVRNLVPDMASPKGYVLDKVESFAIDAQGHAIIVTDNDGVEGSNGETQLLHLGRLAP